MKTTPNPWVHTNLNMRLYKSGDTINSNTVIYLDNRPDGPHAYHKRLSAVYDYLQTGNEADVDMADVPKSWHDNAEMMGLLKKGLDEGAFKDTSLVRQWLSMSNYLLEENGVPLFELVVVQAETHINELFDAITEQGQIPAGVILSGSSKMLTTDLKTDAVIGRTIELIQYFLKNEIPTFGICFGMQMMSYARFGALCEKRHTPADAETYVAKSRSTIVSQVPVTGSETHMIYGVNTIRPRRPHFIVPQSAFDAVALAAEYIPFPNELVPSDCVMAVSDKEYRRADGSAIHVEGVEIIKCGRFSMGTQFHPENRPLFAYLFSYLPEFENMLSHDGHDLQLVRAELKAYIDFHMPASSVAFNWVMQILSHHYMAKHTQDDSYLSTIPHMPKRSAANE